jgi:hypothetical protein
MIATDSLSVRFLGVRTFGMALLVIVVALGAGCGSSKPSGDAGGSGGSGLPGTGGSNGGGTGGSSGSGGERVDLGSFDLNLDGFNLDGFSLDGFSLDGFSLDGLNLDGGFDVNIKACPAGVKTGDNCTAGTDTACLTGQKACFCNTGKWTCLGG